MLSEYADELVETYMNKSIQQQNHSRALLPINAKQSTLNLIMK